MLGKLKKEFFLISNKDVEVDIPVPYLTVAARTYAPGATSLLKEITFYS